ncbi:AAA family ATPase [Janthinobacterium psychrotolerans]|uniref:AAA ATPase domain-containing protein n=1 Tax=Janthinobacterium psychrotolerans TaxID=1747903 RepID=A0A1A7CA13_9BURK|nr:AAA family ATPase [Janthinobacterium psychrotolerans]OBV41153.1 AAA ATPase domain-containing protein [Janthinobacterium psychrotolerans]
MSRVAETRVLYRMMRRMALHGWLRPSELANYTTPPERLAEVFRRLRSFCTIGTGVHDGLWRLTDEARRRLFEGWKREDLVQALSIVPENSVATSLQWALGLQQDHAGTAPSGDLINRRAALNWLPPRLQQAASADHDALTQQIERTAVLEDVRTLVGESFLGRTSQLQRLHNFLSKADVNRHLVNIWGKGGMGKSTLLAAFQQELSADTSTLILRLDFDRPDLNPLVPTSLDREVILQIGREVPSLWNQCREVLVNILEFTAESAREVMTQRYSGRKRHDGSTSYDAGLAESDMESAYASQRSELLHILTLVRPRIRRVVVMFDTFERVESSGHDALYGVLSWLNHMFNTLALPALTVIAGRTPLGGYRDAFKGKLVDMQLNQLSVRDAIALLKLYGCTTELAHLLREHLPIRSPLILRLAFDAVNTNAEEGQALVHKLRTGQIPEDLLSAYLYTRILAHIPHPIIRQYARASLALPELDVNVLANVLMPEVEPDSVDTQAAQDRFDALAAVHWLIERSGERLRLRSDQRELVLHIVDRDSSMHSTLRRVRARALAYHRREPGRWHQAMVLYHRIMRAKQAGVSTEKTGYYVNAVREYASELAPFAADLPDNLRMLLSERRREQINLESAAKLLSAAEWRRIMDGIDGRTGRGQEILSRENPLTAHMLYIRRPTALGSLPPAYALQAACDSARWEELTFDLDGACEALMARFEEADRWGPHLQHLAALVRYTLFENPGAVPPALVDLLSRIVPRCSAYGSAVSLSDIFAIAEVFHKKRYLSPKFLDRMRPSSKTDRVLILRSLNEHRTDFGQLTGAAVVHFDDLGSVASVIMDGSSTAAIEGLAKLEGKRWSEYQRYYRQLGKSWIERGAMAKPRLHLPEFYRPLRQAILDAFRNDMPALSEFLVHATEILPVGPMEFQPDFIRSLTERDPYTWLHAFVQYADWCGMMFDVAAMAIAAKPKHQRIQRVLAVLHRWQSVTDPRRELI